MTQNNSSGKNDLEAREQTELRKQEHLDLCLKDNVSSSSDAGWDSIVLRHKALPEVDMNEVSTRVDFLGMTLDAPFLISSMTGGSDQGERLNRSLAKLAENKNILMGVGSQRVALENREKKYFEIRKAAPRAKLLANIGAVQLNYGVSTDDCQWIVDQLEASALILHANPLQEAIQNEGDRNFKDLWKQIETLKKSISVPLILKETGCGLDAETAHRAIECGVDALDSAGMGGTHWGFIEGLRNPQRKMLGDMFRNWGIPSPQSLRECVEMSRGRVPVIASGGIRNAIDVLRALSLGATLGGMALPFLKAAESGEKSGEESGEESLDQFYENQLEALRIGLFCQGLKQIQRNPS